MVRRVNQFSLSSPVTFYSKKEIELKGIRQFGLVAEEAGKVNPDLVPRDQEGKNLTPCATTR